MAVLAPADAFFVHAETRRVPQTVVALAVADESLTHAALIEAVRERLPDLPWLNRRLVTGRWRRPSWGPAAPDLTWHVRTAELPSPGLAGATAFAAATASRPLPRDRPPWSMTILPGVVPGRVALVVAVHHALADGPHLVTLLGPLLTPVGDVDRLHQPGDHRGTGSRAVGGHQVGDVDRFRVLRGVALLAADGMVRAGPFTARSRAARELAVVSVPLSAVRAAGRRAGAQPTDVVLSALAGAIAATTGTDRGNLRIAVPVLARSADAGRAGNRTAALWVTVPLDETDPVERLRRVAAERAGVARSARPAGALAIVELAGRLPAPLHRLFVAAAYRGRFFHGIVSVMPGPRRRTRFGPSEVTVVHPVLPLAPRVGLGVGALTWGDSLHLGIVTEPGHDPETLAKALVAEIGRTS